MDNNFGIEKLKDAVIEDCLKAGGLFHETGCVKCGGKCVHKYCDKFKWVMDRAQHYADVLGVNKDELINSWEEDRSYWYMNYYQESNQPEITNKRVRVFDTRKALLASVKRDGGGFKCPCCGGVSDSPYICTSGIKIDKKTCDWTSYGFLGTLGKGVYVFCKDDLKGEEMFMPVAWEND